MARRGKKLDLIQEVTTHKNEYKPWPLPRNESPTRQIGEPGIRAPVDAPQFDYQSHLRYQSSVPFDLYIEPKPIIGMNPRDPVGRTKSHGKSMEKNNFVIKPPAKSEIDVEDEEIIYNLLINTYRSISRGVYEDACLKVSKPPDNVEGVLVCDDVNFRPNLYPSLPPGWLNAAKHWDCLQSRVLGDPTKTFWSRRGPEVEKFSRSDYNDLIPSNAKRDIRNLIERNRLRLPYTVAETGYGGYRQISARGVPLERNENFLSGMLRVGERINFSEEEDKIDLSWNKREIFRNSIQKSLNEEKFTFYDGPPFATGLPHYGHVLAGTVKDIVTRFAHQSGHHVERRFGWDCHGLPVEFEIDKRLNITGPGDVMKMGIDKYNNECRSIVMRYSRDWEIIMGRLARWIDFEFDYKTMYPWYMETIWWIFHELYTKGLVYRGVKVMPFSTACSTPLSNFEAGQNYKDVVDPQVIVGFPLDSEPDTMMVAWTTTPWTLPSNLALCVNPEFVYVKVKSLKDNRLYILMEARLCALFKSEKDYDVIEKFPGQKLFGLSYKPIFPYFEEMKSKGAFRILVDKYVSDKDGTGVVHQAPYFGEDDFRVCLEAGIITRDQEMICPIDESGRFMNPVTDFLNVYVKDADKKIIKYLKEKCPERLVESGSVKHSYPFCWRSDTPLIYRAVPSWFIRVEQMVENLLESSRATYWVPDFIKDKRFGNWLKGARDWLVSRNRYWGTPIPLWISEDGKEVVCVGSIQQLEELSGQKVKDLHRESIDHIKIPSARPGFPPLHRVTEVFDCWFESGSMPYAQVHFPFKRDGEINFHRSFPADFIAEGIDQTRGWFYTLLVISTALFNKPPFKNVIANGLILASDGQKMSKSKKNYPDPMEVVKKYGADSLRLYLINSPVVRAENLRFKEEGVRDVLKDVLLPWYNAYRYLAQSIERLVTEEKINYEYDVDKDYVTVNTMDRWFKSVTQTMVATVWTEMAKFHLYKVVPILIDYIDQLTNWYIRMNRKRLKGDNGTEDSLNAINTLFGSLFTFVRIMAPFTPFVCELMYENLKRQISKSNLSEESIHYLGLPKPLAFQIDATIEKRIKSMQEIISAGRIIRDKRTVPMKYPLPEIIVIHKNKGYIEDLKAVENYILEELNVKSIVLSTDCDKYKVSLVADVDHKILGMRLKGDFRSVMQAVKELNDTQVQEFLKKGEIEISGHVLSIDEVFISYRFEEGSYDKDKYEAWSSKEVALLFDMNRDATMLDEGLAREIVNVVQKLRKKGQLVPTDPITVIFKIDEKDTDLRDVIKSQHTYIETLLKVPLRQWSSENENLEFVVEELAQLKGSPAGLHLRIVRGFAKDWASTGSSLTRTVEATKRKSTTASTQALKVIKSEFMVSPGQKEKPSKPVKSRTRKKSQSKDFSKTYPKSQSESSNSNLIKIQNGFCTMSPVSRHVLVKFHEDVKGLNDAVKNGWIVLLEKASNKEVLSSSEFIEEVASLSEDKSGDLKFYYFKGNNVIEINEGNKKLEVDDLENKIVYVYPKTSEKPKNSKDSTLTPKNFPNQPFINVQYNGTVLTLFLIDKKGILLKGKDIVKAIADVFQLEVSNINVYRPCEGPKNNLVVLVK